MRAGIYVRISYDRTGEAAGVRRQEEDCRELAAELEWDIVETYIDNDRSATTGKPRPEYRRMLADIAADRLDGIIIWHTDRLYRRLVDLEELIGLVEDHRIMIRAVRAGEVDLSTPTGRMIARILGSVASHEGEQKSDRWRRSFRQRREAGQPFLGGSRHFGYNRDNTINEDEAETIRWAASEILSGTSRTAVCRMLNERGVQTTAGNRWWRKTLEKTLRSPRLAGLVSLYGEIIGPGDWEPILDRQTWERLHAALDPKRTNPGPPARAALLSGLIFCGREECQHRLHRSAGTEGPVYRCRSVPYGCGRTRVNAARVEAIVEGFTREKLDNEEGREILSRRLASETVNGIIAEVDALEAQIREHEQAIRAAEAEGKRKRSTIAIASAIDDLSEELERKRAQIPTGQVALPEVGTWPEDLERRIALVRLVVAKVWIDPVRNLGGPFEQDRVRIEEASLE